MPKREINLKVLKSAVDAVLDHLVEDLGIENVAIEDIFSGSTRHTQRENRQSLACTAVGDADVGTGQNVVFVTLL